MGVRANFTRAGCWFVLAVSALASSVAAGKLELDGKPSVKKLMGDQMSLTITGGANLPVTLLIDLTAGPTPFLGNSLPLGFTPALVIVPLGNTDPSGTLNLQLTLASSPAAAGAQVFFLAVIADPAAPLGLDITNGADVTLLDRNIDLAGNPLGQYPFFEFVAAVNQGASASLAIDPSQFPFITGRSADVYVVASKTRDQWIADRSLTDIAGGPQAVTFSGASVQANTFTIDPGTLPGTPPGTDLSIPYDVVIDFNRDGVFNGLDLADGYSNDAAGFYVVRDLTQPGPLAVTEILYDLGGVFHKQDTYYPTNIAQMGALPLVMVSHGNGHNYQWYDHIGMHLASYGYVVVSHQNNTEPGSHTAAVSTLENTDGFLGNLGAIAGGALAGHIDTNRIVWVGHSRGGDGIVRAYDKLFTGAFVPVNFARADIKLLTAMAPVDFGGSKFSQPHDTNFHLWVAQADADVNGCADAPLVQPFHIHERAEQARASISLFGVGHDDFHNQVTVSFAEGPCLIGKAKTHLILKGYLLPLIRHHLDGDVAAKDFLWRPYESFRPIGVPFDQCIVADLMFQEGPQSGAVAIDDFQTNPLPSLASSGATVAMTVPGYAEGLLDDGNTDFADQASDVFNGYTMGASNDGARWASDDSRGAVFSVDGAGDYDLTYQLTASQRDVSDFGYLQFRAAQGTRHALTLALAGKATFSVRLRDGAGKSSTINIGAYGGGIDSPYLRHVVCRPPVCRGVYTCGTGNGWNSDFETTRIRLLDFLNNGSNLDLSDIREVAFLFGPSWGSSQARLGLDEIEWSK